MEEIQRENLKLNDKGFITINKAGIYSGFFFLGIFTKQ